jgi:hypothetical protein
LTGTDFYDAFDWLADTLQAETVFTSCSIFAAVLVKIASGEFNLARFKSIQAKIVDQFMADLDIIAENMSAYNSGMEVSLHEKLQLVCVKRNKLVCALVQGIDDSLTRGRLISERLLKQYEHHEGPIENNELKEWVENSFPLDIAN